MEDLYQTENWLKTLKSLDDLSVNDWSNVKRRGFADVQISRALNCHEDEVRAARLAAGVKPSMKRVDTCAAEFEVGWCKLKPIVTLVESA